MFFSNKDKILIGLKSNCVYEFNYPGCPASYIGKTDTNLDCHDMENGTHREDQATIVYKHLTNCSSFLGIVNMLNTPVNNESQMSKIILASYILNAAINNINLLTTNSSLVQLGFIYKTKDAII